MDDSTSTKADVCLLDTSPATLSAIGEAAAGRARAASDRDLVDVLRGCSEEWDEVTYVTCWFGGVWDTRDGEVYWIEWPGLGREMAAYANNVVDKGRGLWFTPALSKNGGCKDEDISQITQLSFDADGAGHWCRGLQILNRAEIAHIATHSSSHSPEHPKFHLHVPLADHWSGDKSAWRQLYRHGVGYFSGAFRLAGSASGTSTLGFDAATDRLGQPWFWSARRTEHSPVPEVRVARGKALNLQALLDATGFAPAIAQPRVRRRPVRKRPAVGVLTGQPSLLERAFAHAGWLGPLQADGIRVVRCPWDQEHMSGTPMNGSTVLFPPDRSGGRGWFLCHHSHCVSRTQDDVLRALPPVALRAAILDQARGAQ